MKDLLMTALTAQLEKQFNAEKFQVTKNISLIAIPKDIELKNFYSLLNNEILFETFLPSPQE